MTGDGLGDLLDVTYSAVNVRCGRAGAGCTGCFDTEDRHTEFIGVAGSWFELLLSCYTDTGPERPNSERYPYPNRRSGLDSGQADQFDAVPVEDLDAGSQRPADHVACAAGVFQIGVEGDHQVRALVEHHLVPARAG